MGNVAAFLRLPFSRKVMVLEAFLLSGWYRHAMLHFPFPRIASTLGKPGLETPRHAVQTETVRSIAWAVGAACRRTPWQSQCLVQALTARKMLSRRRIGCTLYMGARRTPQGEAQAHAWVRSGPLFVCGGDGSRDYAVTSLYGTSGKTED